MCYFSGLESQLPGESTLTIEQLELTAKNEVPVRTSSEDSMVSQQSGESNPITIEQLEPTAKNQVPVQPSSEDSMVSQQSGESNPIDSNQSDVEQSGKCIFL